MAVHRRVASAGSSGRPWLLSAALVLPLVLPAHAAPADEPTERRLTVTLLTLDMAQTACGFRVARDRLAALLAAANVTRDQLYGRPITPTLQASIDGLRDGFTRNAPAACAEAWRQFGPASAPNLLTR
ncbi:hypothetical protein Q8W71_05850 [Methylobacterium sp. NEAU 140]|uniref:hypothetical protein n=1 Tax=Methylobacterium sp. NEAU 140 TaxID=3064945 RepID=UPI0027362A49|nr:hypothetical protein [Methylobacterium sp. NEAU 140]MDP4022136.1 hypothetical protein [Methylobacterium sp. NEAU 140]